MFLQILMLTTQNKCHAAYFFNTRVSPNGFLCSEVWTQGCSVWFQGRQSWGAPVRDRWVTCQRGWWGPQCLGRVGPMGSWRGLV